MLSSEKNRPNILSVNVGQPREIALRDRVVLTSIFKPPVHGRIAVRGHNIEGDRQSDLRVHGGPYKAVYAYAFEHYSYWANELPDTDLTWGAFGENLTLEGLTEEIAYIGDQYRAGSAVLEITQPRMPCFKLNLRFERSDMVKRFWRSGYSGIYFSIVEEGELGAGDELEFLNRRSRPISVAEVVRLYKGETHDEEVFERMLHSPLRGSWKQEIRERCAESPLPLFT
ncbi:MAG: MOSC domain-containing protein [Acidobacteriaceae bacterium]|nr:MOSC domain-containing protein [Acidobacteriaceae bacterium]